MSTLASVFGYGLLSARAAASVAGRFYYATDTQLMYRDNGSTWDTLSIAGAGTGTFTTIKNEGTNLSTAAVSMDFVGAGVDATGTTAATVTIPGPVFSGAKVYNNGTQSVTSGAETVITFGGEEYDTDSYHDTGSNTGRLTVPTTDKYRFTAVCPPAGNAAGIPRVTGFRVNGSGYVRGGYQTLPGGGALGGSTVQLEQALVTDMSLSANDYVEVFVYQNTGGNLNYGDTDSNKFAQCAFSVHRLR